MPEKRKSKEKSLNKNRKKSNDSLSLTEKNYHHVLIQEPDEYISYESITGNQKKNKAVIKDSALYQTVVIPVLQPDISYDENNTAEPPVEIDSKKLFEQTESEEQENISNAEKFISEQGIKHPKVYFAVGFSIFLLAILGLASFVYIGLNALRTFSQNYQETTITTAAYIIHITENNI